MSISDKALKNAQALKLRELEGEIRAEIAHSTANKVAPKSARPAQRSRENFTDEGSTKAARWAKELSAGEAVKFTPENLHVACYCVRD